MRTSIAFSSSSRSAAVGASERTLAEVDVDPQDALAVALHGEERREPGVLAVRVGGGVVAAAEHHQVDARRFRRRQQRLRGGEGVVAPGVEEEDDEARAAFAQRPRARRHRRRGILLVSGSEQSDLHGAGVGEQGRPRPGNGRGAGIEQRDLAGSLRDELRPEREIARPDGARRRLQQLVALGQGARLELALGDHLRRRARRVLEQQVAGIDEEDVGLRLPELVDQRDCPGKTAALVGRAAAGDDLAGDRGLEEEGDAIGRRRRLRRVGWFGCRGGRLRRGAGCGEEEGQQAHRCGTGSRGAGSVPTGIAGDGFARSRLGVAGLQCEGDRWVLVPRNLPGLVPGGLEAHVVANSGRASRSYIFRPELRSGRWCRGGVYNPPCPSGPSARTRRSLPAGSRAAARRPPDIPCAP